MRKLNSQLFKNKMTESKKSTEDIPGNAGLKVEVRGGEEYKVRYIYIGLFRLLQLGYLKRNYLQVNIK